MEELISHQEILEKSKKLGISPRKLESLRDNDLFPKPIERRGEGRAKGVSWMYPSSALSQLEHLADLTKRFRSYDEVRWQLWLEGDIAQWERIKEKLLESFPDTNIPEPIPNEFLDEFEGEFLPFFRKWLLRRNPFGNLSDNFVMAFVYYLMWPLLFGKGYEVETDDYSKKAFEKSFGSLSSELHSRLTIADSYHPQKWLQALSKSNREIANMLTDIFKLMDQDFEKKENRRLNRLLHTRFGQSLFLWKIRAIFAGLLLMMQQSIMESERKKNN